MSNEIVKQLKKIILFAAALFPVEQTLKNESLKLLQLHDAIKKAFKLLH